MSDESDESDQSDESGDDFIIPIEDNKKEDSTPAVIDYEAYAAEFTTWALNHEFVKSFVCRFEIDRLSPFAEVADDLWAIWANHDCLDWEVRLKMVMDQETSENVIATTGLKLLDGQECSRMESTNGRQYVSCNFLIEPRADNFSILFKGGFSLIWYDFEWEYLG